MKIQNTIRIVICLAVVGAASCCFATIAPPDPDLSTAEMLALPPGVQVSVFNTPAGDGYAMTQARTVDTAPLTWLDATITITLLNEYGTAIFAYPQEDMWLECLPEHPPAQLGDPAGLVACPGGALADGSTDINGQTTFSGPFHAGGHATYSDNGLSWDDSKTYVWLGGYPINSPLDVLFNSADIDGDGAWTSDVDVILFVQRYRSGEYSYSVDFFFDEYLDLSDLVLFSNARNQQCP